MTRLAQQGQTGGNNPRPAELQLLVNRLGTLRTSYRADREAATKLLGIGESKPDANLDPAELAAHTALGTLLFNLDEAVSKE